MEQAPGQNTTAFKIVAQYANSAPKIWYLRQKERDIFVVMILLNVSDNVMIIFPLR